MIGRLINWLRSTERHDLDDRRREAALQHERAARRAVVTGVDTTIRCDDAKETIEALLLRMKEKDARNDA